MFERVILIKLRPEAVNAENRDHVAEAARALSTSDGGVQVVAGLPADGDAERSWDVLVRVDTTDAAAFARFTDGAAFRRFHEEVVEPRAIVVKAWGFDVA